MKKFLLALTAAGLALGGSAATLQAQAPAQAPTKTVMSGVYTAEQAAQGKLLFESKCAMCHGRELDGGQMAPPLVGGGFIGNWQGTSLGDLFVRIHLTMPQNDPLSLTNTEVATVMAYILSFNQYPAGATPLPNDEAGLNGIGIVEKK
ncbi:MAG TPA: cytochrome c [Rhizomicrobium sp.]|nr:cytochrome c [Rhizomicrobium sp.]